MLTLSDDSVPLPGHNKITFLQQCGNGVSAFSFATEHEPQMEKYSNFFSSSQGRHRLRCRKYSLWSCLSQIKALVHMAIYCSQWSFALMWVWLQSPSLSAVMVSLHTKMFTKTICFPFLLSYAHGNGQL